MAHPWAKKWTNLGLMYHKLLMAVLLTLRAKIPPFTPKPAHSSSKLPCGAKHAIQGFTESVRSELIHDKSNVKITMVQLPAVNTPQFGWVKSRLPHKAQPVSPIYQPEVIADAVTWVADHDRRQLFIGGSTVIVIQGNKLASGFGDWYLGKTGYASQQIGEPEDPDRPHNLWEPVDEQHDYGAHGAFDDRVRNRSWQLWADTHRGWLALLGVGIAGAIAALLVRK